MTDKALKPIAGVLIALLIVGFSPLVDAETGWKETLGGIVWWSIFVLGAALLVLGGIAFAARRRAGAS
jgi:hypothetical protein